MPIEEEVEREFSGATDAIAPLTPEQLLDRLGVTLEELLMVNRHMLSALQQIAERGGSSVEIDSNGRAGEPKLKVKLYEGSAAPVDEALADYGRAMHGAAAASLNGWQETVERLREAVGDR